MAITNGYCTLYNLKAALKIDQSDTTDDAALELAVESASRQIDDLCGKGRKFWQDGTVVARTYYPNANKVLLVDDISTTTGLVVKVDTTDDGTFDTTLTINADFILLPLNAAAEFPVQPWEAIKLLDGTISGWQRLSSGRPYVEVTAKFGWSAVPDAIERAAVIQAKTIFRSMDTNYQGGYQSGYDGVVYRIPAVDPIARTLIERHIRYTDVDDGN